MDPVDCNARFSLSPRQQRPSVLSAMTRFACTPTILSASIHFFLPFGDALAIKQARQQPGTSAERPVPALRPKTAGASAAARLEQHARVSIVVVTCAAARGHA